MSDLSSEENHVVSTDEPQEAPTLKVESPRPIPTDAWEVACAEWINSHVRNSPIAGAIEAWNHLGTVLPKLRDFLEKNMKNSPPA